MHDKGRDPFALARFFARIIQHLERGTDKHFHDGSGADAIRNGCPGDQGQKALKAARVIVQAVIGFVALTAE